MSSQTVKLKTGGTHCASCSMLIEMTVSDLRGVVAVKADYASGTAEVAFDPSAIDLPAIIDAIESAGYTAQPV